MFTKVEATNSQGSLLTLQLGDVSGGINVENITGLDPVKATLVSSSFANQDGAVYQSSRRDTRNIVLTLGLDPDPTLNTVLSLRRYVYSFFRPKDQITLKFYVDDTDDSIEDGYLIAGVVESCLSEMFAQEPVINISVMCFDPDFQDPIPVNVTELQSTDIVSTEVDYGGTTPTGLVFTVNVNQTLSEFSIYFVDPSNNTWSMDVSASFVTGDTVTISTVPGNKYATLLRAGVTSSILYAVSLQSTWYQFAPGTNRIRLHAASSTAMPGSFSYVKRYGEL